ncbi:MAG TPA: hypothetical protein VGB76_16870 [Pyrinomonadaceae bacterium]|jgi:hypothetical protein
MSSRARCLSLLLLAGLYTFTLVTPSRAQQIAHQTDAVRSSPLDVLRSAQTIFIRTKTAYFKPAALEQSLLDRTEVQSWELVFTREEANADLIIEVDRKLFTNKFVYSVIDPRTNTVLISGKIGSLGGTVEDQIANGFVKRLQRFRTQAAPARFR